MAIRKQAQAKKTAAKRPSKKTSVPGSKTAKSMPKAGKDPRGGLTAEGRAFFAKKEGSHLRPGVKGAADMPEKMVRKGSFLRRHFAHPRGPMVDEQGRPTRLALSAQAWGEPLPKTMAAAKKLADKGPSATGEVPRRAGQESRKGRPHRFLREAGCEVTSQSRKIFRICENGRQESSA